MNSNERTVIDAPASGLRIRMRYLVAFGAFLLVVMMNAIEQRWPTIAALCGVAVGMWLSMMIELVMPRMQDKSEVSQ